MSLFSKPPAARRHRVRRRGLTPGSLVREKIAPLVTSVVLSLLALPAATQEIADSAWLAGSWVERKDGTVTEEIWLPPGGGMMVAINRTVEPGKRTTFELLRIELRDGRPVYFASPGGQSPTEFKSTEATAARVVFENPAHDFPQRVLYWHGGKDILFARIEGKIQGKDRSRQWRFERMK